MSDPGLENATLVLDKDIDSKIAQKIDNLQD